MDTPLVEGLMLPDVPHVVFSSSPLVYTICQVRFAPVLGIANASFVASFQQAVQERYPIVTPNKQLGIEIEFGSGDPVTRTGETIAWRFSDQNDNWAIVLSTDFLSIETRVYDEFSDFLEQLRFVLEALTQFIQPKIGMRIGLRYINELRPGHNDWRSLIREELLGPLAVKIFADHTQIAMQEIKLALDNLKGITIRHGLLPQGSTVQPPEGIDAEKLRAPFYLLDFDIYQEFRRDEPLVMDPDVVCSLIEAYNETVYRLFRWSVTEQYVQTLGVRNNGSN